jgi:hypothetical protein
MNYSVGPVTPLGIPVEHDQLWKEVDPRFHRVVKVVGWDRDNGKIQLECNNRYTYATLSRFNGKRGGYEPYKKEETK